MRVRTLCIVIGLVLGVSALSAREARAIEIGEVAPDVEGKDFFNCEPLSLVDLRGRLVLLELFSTG